MKRKKSERTKPPAQTPQVPEKIPQPHGGALYAGGVAGHRGGSGRPPSVVRAAFLDGAEQAIPKLVAQLDSKNELVVQGAADKLAKYGLGTQRDVRITLDDIRDRLRKSIESIRRLAPHEVAERIITDMKGHWK